MATKSSATALHAKLAESLDTANQGAHETHSHKAMTTHTSHSHTSHSTHTKHKASHAAEGAATHELAELKKPELNVTKIVDSSMLLAAGAGAIPLPIWDTVAIMAVQVKMLADLSAFYGVPFKENAGKAAVASLIGGLAPGLLARGTFGLFLKLLPGVGSVFGAIAQPAFAAALTYGMGKVFISHFESGGTLLTFNAKDFKSTLTDEVKAGMKKVTELKI
jgi:uncharacterized protein (DUF697 family)